MLDDNHIIYYKNHTPLIVILSTFALKTTSLTDCQDPEKKKHNKKCYYFNYLKHEGGASVATVITDVFRKKRINVSNKFMGIMKIFTKINDLKNCRVI